MALATRQEDKKETALFVKFMTGKKILIADPSSSARSGLFIIFRDLDIKPNQIILVNTYQAAEEQIVSVKPHLVVAEYDLGKRCGVELLQNQRKERPKETKECIFTVVTGNTSQAAVARAAEEDIDAYILKPLTPDMVRKTLLRTAISKIKPPQYIQLIEAGKALMEQGDFDGAIRKFEEATPYDTSPSLAHFYLGQVRFAKKILTEAQGNYSKGLEYNKIHYKCMVGLYELFVSLQQHANAYEVVKKLSQYFPSNPKRLAEVLRLAIVNKKYEDIEKYYSIFINIEDRDEVLIKYICAALVVCGRYYLGTKTANKRALELFQKAVATSAGRVNVIKETVAALIDYKIFKEARLFLERYPLELQTSAEYQMLKFTILNAEAPLSVVIAAGRDLIAGNVIDEKLFEIMLKRYLEAGSATAAEQTYYNAIKCFPQKESAYKQIYESKAH